MVWMKGHAMNDRKKKEKKGKKKTKKTWIRCPAFIIFF